MKGYSRDMFEEMDEMFARLLSQVQQEMLDKNQPPAGYRIVIEGTNFPRTEEEILTIQPRATNTPAAEVHHIDDEVKVIVELPGARADSVRLDVRGRQLIIDAGEAEMAYHTAAALPPVDPGSMQQSFRNGVLEVTFRSLAEPKASV